MAKIKDIPRVDRPREKFLKKGPEALSKSDLLAILLGSGVKGKNVQQISQQIINRFGKNFLNITVDDLKKIEGIGSAKALQIVSAIFLVKRFYTDNLTNEIKIKNFHDLAPLVHDLRNKKKEYLACVYLNARNVLLKREIVSIGLADKTLLHPREIFYPATTLNATGVIVIHNHPSGDSSPSNQDIKIFEKIISAGEIMGIHIIDCVIVSELGDYSFYRQLSGQKEDFDYTANEAVQGTLFDLLEIERPVYETSIRKADRYFPQIEKIKDGYFKLQNRRYLGNKHKLLGFIQDIISEKCGLVNSLFDIFAGTGVVGERFNNSDIKIISNDFLFANYICLQAFLGTAENLQKDISKKIEYLNSLSSDTDNYFSENFGGTYFTVENARKIGIIREAIDQISESIDEKNALICSLIYATDKIANTVGHYDAFRKKMDMLQPVKMLTPAIDYSLNANNEIYKEDANALVRKITCDVLYIDPPYNSRQYSDAYHLLENLARWEKPEVVGIGRKMDRSYIKSKYCLQNAVSAFADLIENANCKHILLSYNNTANSKNERSNARINDDAILHILNKKGDLEIFEKEHKAFTTGKSNGKDNTERIFYCQVTK